MSYEIVKRLRIENGEVLITCDSNRKFYTKLNIGKSKYVINFHDGVKTHKDGSEFYDIAIFSNKLKYNSFKNDLIKQGYKEI